MKHLWTIRGSGDLQLLLEQGHRQRRLALAIKQQLVALPYSIEHIAEATERIKRHMDNFAKIMRYADLYEKSTQAEPLIIDLVTWDVVAAA